MKDNHVYTFDSFSNDRSRKTRGVLIRTIELHAEGEEHWTSQRDFADGSSVSN